jgi:hypothetical protein
MTRAQWCDCSSLDPTRLLSKTIVSQYASTIWLWAAASASIARPMYRNFGTLDAFRTGLIGKYAQIPITT